MDTNPAAMPQTPKRPRRSPGPLPPPPPGVAVMTREEAGAFMGVTLGTFGIWERDGRVTIPRYRVSKGSGRAIFYTVADLTRLREEFKKLVEPYPDPTCPGVYRVPISGGTQRLEALIDAEDVGKVEGKRWNTHRRGESEEIEVILSTWTERQTPLKRIIMGVDGPECKEQLVCFVNGDPLDCRRANLALKSWSEVNQTRTKSAVRAGRAASSRYRGVDWDAKRRLWRAQAGGRGKNRQLGRFRDEAQAAAAYDAAAREAFGASAALNFPDGNVPAPTFLDPDGQPVREKNAYRVPRGLPTPPEGVRMLTREEAALALDVSTGTLGVWERAGHVAIPRYRAKDTTGTPILYAAADIARLREQLDSIGQPYPDPHPARANVWRVPLRTLDGYIEALIDEADLHHVRGKKWNFAVREGSGYRKGTVFLVGPRDVERVQLDRLVMGLSGEGHTKRVNHVNGNPLDCRRANLVIGTPARSTRASFKLLHRCGRPTTSRFKGVCWLERVGRWQSQIRIDDVPRVLGFFDEEEDAALAYDEAAREIWGEEARVNFPRAGEKPSAAAPVAPAELWSEASFPAHKLPGAPRECAVVVNDDGSMTLSWRCVNAAASAGVTFAVLRRLPGQREFARIGTAPGTTHESRRATFTDTTAPAPGNAAPAPGNAAPAPGNAAPGNANAAPGIVNAAPAADPSGDGTVAEYIVRASRGTFTGEASPVLVARCDADDAARVRTMPTRAAA